MEPQVSETPNGGPEAQDPSPRPAQGRGQAGPTPQSVGARPSAPEDVPGVLEGAMRWLGPLTHGGAVGQDLRADSL